MLLLCIKIFLVRILDVSLGTVRTIMTVKNKNLIASIIGFIEISDVIDRYEINNVYVLENYRHNGIASMLMEKVIESGKESNIENITLEVNKNNIQAIGLYKKYDFKECAIRKGYYNGVDGILMKKEMI